MTDQNKENFREFGKFAAFALPVFIALITFAGILNGVVACGLDNFYAWVGGLNLGVEGFLLYKWYKYLFDEKK